MNRKLRNQIRLTRWPLILFHVLTLIVLIGFISPENSGSIILLILVSTSLSYLVSSVFLSLKRSIMIAAFVFLTLCMSALIGFNLFNTLLLLSFIIVVGRIVPTKTTSEKLNK